MTHDHASAPPSPDALHDDLGPETLARVLDGLRALPPRDPQLAAGDTDGAGEGPAVPLPRRR